MAICSSLKYWLSDRFQILEIIFQNSLQVQKNFKKKLWIHRPLNTIIDFPEMPTPMGDSLCHLARIDVKHVLFRLTLLYVIVLIILNYF